MRAWPTDPQCARRSPDASSWSSTELACRLEDPLSSVHTYDKNALLMAEILSGAQPLIRGVPRKLYGHSRHLREWDGRKFLPYERGVEKVADLANDPVARILDDDPRESWTIMRTVCIRRSVFPCRSTSKKTASLIGQMNRPSETPRSTASKSLAWTGFFGFPWPASRRNIQYRRSRYTRVFPRASHATSSSSDAKCCSKLTSGSAR